MIGSNESKGRPPREGGRNGGAPGRGKGGKPHHKGADNAAGRGEGKARGTDQKKGRSARSDLPILIYGKGENIKTNLVEFTEQLAFVAGVEFGDAFNCVRVGEYFTYAIEPYRGTISEHLYTLRKLDEEIAATGNQAEKRALRLRKETLDKDHNAKTPDEIADEDTGRLEDWKGKNRSNQKKRVKLDKDKKKLFFTIWANMSEVSIQKVKEHLTVPVWLELERNSQDPLILWNAIKATHAIVKQDNDELTLFAAENAYNNIRMKPDELPNSYYNCINEAVDMVKSQGVDVESERTYSEKAKVLRMVKGLDSVRFGELRFTLDQDQKRGLNTMPKTMLEALQLINEFKIRAPSSMQKPGGPFKAVFAASVSTKVAPKGKSGK
jgi:hypothetical protein